MNDNWADELIIQYEAGRAELNEIKKGDAFLDMDKMDRKEINSMINELSDVIKWLKTGRDPYEMRGTDRKSAYQRRVLYDMELFPSLDIVPESLKSRELTTEEQELIADILLTLSPRERHCYMLHYINLRSFAEIADELNISKGSVQSYIERARSKIKSEVDSLTNAI